MNFNVSSARSRGGAGDAMDVSVSAVRLPPNYRLVYDVVQAQEPGVHAPAGDIFARARALKPSLGYSTVYRALDRLCRLGLVLELHIPGQNAALFEPARAGHAHFVCGACGRVEDVDCPVPDRDIQTAVDRRGGTVNEIVLTVHGICSACRHAGSNSVDPRPS